MRGGIFDYLDWTVQPWPDRIKTFISSNRSKKYTNVNKLPLTFIFSGSSDMFYMRLCMKY